MPEETNTEIQSPAPVAEASVEDHAPAQQEQQDAPKGGLLESFFSAGDEAAKEILDFLNQTFSKLSEGVKNLYSDEQPRVDASNTKAFKNLVDTRAAKFQEALDNGEFDEDLEALKEQLQHSIDTVASQRHALRGNGSAKAEDIRNSLKYEQRAEMEFLEKIEAREQLLEANKSQEVSGKETAVADAGNKQEQLNNSLADGLQTAGDVLRGVMPGSVASTLATSASGMLRDTEDNAVKQTVQAVRDGADAVVQTKERYDRANELVKDTIAELPKTMDRMAKAVTSVENMKTTGEVVLAAGRGDALGAFAALSENENFKAALDGFKKIGRNVLTTNNTDQMLADSSRNQTVAMQSQAEQAQVNRAAAAAQNNL